jgi:class 3 adenylate cyclase/tetratricopeptide (TPR) repeat protein
LAVGTLIAGTFLFTDLVGSTELTALLTVDDADRLRAAHFSSLRRAIEAVGATEVKKLGDGVMVFVSSPSRALACAVGMQQAVEAQNRRTGTALAVRIGIATGEATEEDGDYFGAPVIEAARLCAAAAGGQILASELVRATAGRRASFEMVAVGELYLKGLPEPVPIVEVRWEPAEVDGTGAQEVRLPDYLVAAQPELGFFGRANELEGLVEAYTAAVAGRGRRVVLVSGEPGMGKTTLVAEAARGFAEQGAMVCYGRVDEELGIPYQPFSEILGHLVDHLPEDLFRPFVAREGYELVRLVPGMARRLPEEVGSGARGDLQGERHVLFSAVLGLLRVVTVSQPLVLVLDDLHWADRATLLLLRHLVRGAGSLPVLIVGTYRASQLSAADPMQECLAALHREQGVLRVDLAGWDDTDIVALMETAAGEPLGRAGTGLAHALSRETGGNPFFVGEILRHLNETGHIFQEATGRWVTGPNLADVGLPQSVREVVGARVARLGPDAHAMLSAAAVIGRDFALDLMAAVCGRSEDDVLEVLEAAAAASLVFEVRGNTAGRFSFTHILYQHTLYDGLGPTRAARLHLKVAQALEGICDTDPGPRMGELAFHRASGTDPGPRVVELALHWAKAVTPVDPLKMVDYSRRAGEAALATLAPDEAVRWFSLALGQWDRVTPPDDELRADLLIGLGTAQRQSGDPAHRGTLLEAGAIAQRLGDRPRLIQVALAAVRPYTASPIGAFDPDLVALWRAACEAAPGGGAEKARLLGAIAAEHSWSADWPTRRHLVDGAVDVARACGDPATVVWVHNVTSTAVMVPDNLAKLLADGAEAVALAKQVGDPVALFWALVHQVRFCMAAGDLTQVDTLLNALVPMAERLNQPDYRWRAGVLRAGRTLLAGNFREAEDLVTVAFQQGSGHPAEDFCVYWVSTLEIRRQQGRLAEIADEVLAVLAGAPGLSYTDALAADVLCAVGRHEEARARLEPVVADRFSSVPYNLVWLNSMAVYARVCAQLGDLAAARALYERVVPWTGLVAYFSLHVDGAMAHTAGALAAMLEEFDQAETHLSQALAIHRRLGAPYWTAATSIELAGLRAARRIPGDIERARAEVDDALQLVARFGCGGLDAPARALGVRLGSYAP